MKITRVAVIALVVAGAVAIGVSVASVPEEDDGIDLTLTMADGTTADLSSFRGTPVVLNFWASWCPACVAEMPDFQQVHEAFGDDVVFIGVNVQEVSASAAERLLAETGVTYDIALDPTGDLYRRFGGIAMPTTVFIGADGTVSDVHSGVLFADDLTKRLVEELAA